MKKLFNSLYKISSKAVYVILILAMTVSVSSVIVKPSSVYADQYDDQIRALQAQNAAYAQQIAALSAQASTLATAIAELQAQSAVLQNQVDISQAKYDKLVIQIKETETRIQEGRDALGQTLADMYVDDDITPIEMLASSKNISDYLDRQEYRNSIKENLSSKIADIKSLKASLEKDKAEVEKVLNDQKTQRDELARRHSEQANLLSATRGQESTYQSMIGANQAKIAEARATQALINSRINSSGGAVLVDSGLLTAYPWNSSNCPMIGYLSTGGSNGSGGDGYGYGCRQCASYAAWRIAKETGIYYRWGNAIDFTGNARRAGYTYLGMNAQAGSIAVMDPAKAGQGYGHVAWVEGVSGDGRQVLVSQYNYDYGAGYGMYSKMWLSVNAFDHYVRII